MNTSQLASWLWGQGFAAGVARIPLVPFSVLYSAAMTLRTAAYARGLIPTEPLPLPAVAVGNLTVGGAGKTPVAGWIARYFAARGVKPGILLRGYGDDETLVHRRLVPEAVVVADPDRLHAARRAAAAGAQILVLDDAFQTLRVARDLNIALINADRLDAPRWLLPAGPFREGASALGRADVIVVTRKRAQRDAAAAHAERLARRWPAATVAVGHLACARFEGLESGANLGARDIAGRRVLAAAGIADPEAFRAQLEAAGASVQLQAYQDHHRYTPRDLDRLARAAAAADYVVVTEKDAVKLRGLWPTTIREPLVAVLDLEWERNEAGVEQALHTQLSRTRVPKR